MSTIEQAKGSMITKGFLDVETPKEMDYVAEIKKLKEEKNAVILAHYYQEEAIQDIADFVGDSLALAQEAAKTDADIIVEISSEIRRIRVLAEFCFIKFPFYYFGHG